MALSAYNLFPDGERGTDEALIPDGVDLTVPVTLHNGSRNTIVAIVPEDRFGYVWGIELDVASVTDVDPEVLAAMCHDDNLRAVMISGERHVVKLHSEHGDPSHPSALVIEYLDE